MAEYEVTLNEALLSRLLNGGKEGLAALLESVLNQVLAAQAQVARALELAGIGPVVYEYPMQTGYYWDEYHANPSLENLDRFWNSLIPLEGIVTAPVVEVDESEEALDAKMALIEAWDIEWMGRLVERYGEEALRNGFLDYEKYRELKGDYDYTRPPYDSQPRLYEFLENWPYVFEDLANYAACLSETYGADLWTVPSVTYGEEREPIEEGALYDFQVGLSNKAWEGDTFTLQGFWGDERRPAVELAFKDPVVELGARETTSPLVTATLDTTGLSGELTLWIRATSEKAGEDPGSRTDYVEFPFMIRVGERAWGPASTVVSCRPATGERTSRLLGTVGVLLVPAAPWLALFLRRRKGPRVS